MLDDKCSLLERVGNIIDKKVEEIQGGDLKQSITNNINELKKYVTVTEDKLTELRGTMKDVKLDNLDSIMNILKGSANNPDEINSLIIIMLEKGREKIEELELEKSKERKIESQSEAMARLSAPKVGGGLKKGLSYGGVFGIVCFALLCATGPVGLAAEGAGCVAVVVFAITGIFLDGGGNNNFDCEEVMNMINSINEEAIGIMMTKKDEINELVGEEVKEQPVKQQVEEPVEKSVFDTGDMFNFNLNKNKGGRRTRSKRNKRVKGGFTKKKGGKKKSNKKRVINVTKGGRRKLSKTRRNVRSKK